MRTQKPLASIIQAGWWMLTGFSVLLFLLAAPAYYQQLTQVCIKAPCLAMQLTTGRAILLELSGLGFQLYARLIIAIQVLVYLINLSIGVFIFSRKSNDSLAILVSLMLITTLQADLYRGLQSAYPASFWPTFLLGALNSILLVVFFWSIFDQSYSTWTLFARDYMILDISIGSWSASSGRSSARPSIRRKGPRRRLPRFSG